MKYVVILFFVFLLCFMNNCMFFKSVCEIVYGCVYLFVVYKYYIFGLYDNLLVFKILGFV